MSKNSKTDEKAFNGLHLRNIDWKRETLNSQKAIQADKAKRLAELTALIAADEAKLNAVQSVKVTDDSILAVETRFSGLPEYLDSKYEYENSK